MESQPNDLKPDVIYVHSFPGSWTKQMINLSPFAVKLQSFLRINKIEYEVIETRKFSSTTRQMPYIIYNGEEVADTYFIIDFLRDKFNLDPSEGLSDEQVATTRFILKFVDESVAATIFLYRYSYYNDEFSQLFYMGQDELTKGVLARLKTSHLDRADKTGLGRHTRDQIAKLAKDDMKAISLFLGEKKFLFGDKIKLADCALFGHLVQVFYTEPVPFPHKEVLQEDCGNIKSYLDRIKAEVWPDWDDIVDNAPFPTKL